MLSQTSSKPTAPLYPRVTSTVVAAALSITLAIPVSSSISSLATNVPILAVLALGTLYVVFYRIDDSASLTYSPRVEFSKIPLRPTVLPRPNVCSPAAITKRPTSEILLSSTMVQRNYGVFVFLGFSDHRNW